MFFDLVFVFAITQLSHGLIEHLTPTGVLQTTLLMMTVWWAWMYTTWATNWLDPDRPTVRLLLFVLMLGGLVMSAAIPKAFESRGLAFVLAYCGSQIGRSLFLLWALKLHDPANHLNFIRITIWFVASKPLWIAGAFLDSGPRLVLWAIALTVDYLGPIAYFRVPGLGRSTTAEWTIEGAHMAERCGLFIIIALGESILITGANFAKTAWTTEHVAAFVVAFIGSVAMWAVYFNVGAERNSRAIAETADSGRMARNAYTYVHLPIVAGIIVCAVADEMVLHHPGGHVDLKTAIVFIGGPAIYLAGNAAFKRFSAPYVPLSHLAGLALLRC